MITLNEPTMRRLNKASRSFFVCADVLRLLSLAHDEQREWNSEIRANTIDGPDGKPERKANGMPKMTGGYEIHIVIHPPKKARSTQRRKRKKGAARN
jgi:hypothetical protein